MRVLSVNVSMPLEIEWKGQLVKTSIFKSPVAGKVIVRRLNLEGDLQSDQLAHGGEHRALMVYQKESYEYWRTKLQREDLHYGQFGENLTVEGLADADVCIGDRYKIGTAIFEVTQPRVTCYKVGISLGVPEMPALLVSNKRPGFYFRVIQEGELTAGDEIYKIADGPEGMSVAEIDALLYSSQHPADKLSRALKIPALSNGWQLSFRELAAAVDQGATGNAGLTGAFPPPAWKGFRELRVRQIKQESADVRSFVLEAADGAALPGFLPGQHVTVRITVGPDKPKILRTYSLCGPPDDGYYHIAVKLEEGPGSIYLHQHLQVGDILEVSAPRGSFTLAANNDPVILLSAGVGITPLLGMLYALARKPDGREVWWIHSARDSAHHSFAHEIKELSVSLPGLHAVTLYSRPLDMDKAGGHYDYAGHLNTDILRGLHIPATSNCYLCGPDSYLTATTAALTAIGIAPERIYKELFDNIVSPGSAKAPHKPIGAEGNGPLVTFTKSKISFAWDNRFNNLLEAAEACDVQARWSCRTGVCHRCESALLDGQVSYSPEPLDAPADGNVLICCARPETDVSIDL
ncbi:MOSC domain-containing protein [Chitinophaga agrisoli]|uniref:MOSC domain-containing protein n=1 Tax=Chitinophaga agrisoli TaxID=2607653 RepID=A0A5B2VSA8_9BACT|nr:MOSC and FAD-binding oxidoreductase domain-containing protein [Chitinophaga agrisoli]KAA2242653.1 MOSC domain-containing protein [Chitinophaga agrisoli]